MSPLDPAFVPHLVDTFNDPGTHGVHVLFNRFWAHADDATIAAYLDQLQRDEGVAAAVAARHYAEPLSLEQLAACPLGSFGRALERFVVDNGLEAKLATNYRQFHETLRSSGMLDRMPEDIAYVVLRGFQLHDCIHVVTGYGPSPRDELALQAFCLAQLRFPYFAMWMSVVTTRMTFLVPDTISGVMDAITEGWRFGRSTPSLQLERWEDYLAEPLDTLRARYGIDPGGRRPLTVPDGGTAATG